MVVPRREGAADRSGDTMMHIRYGMPVALALGLLATAAVAKHDGRPAASLDRKSVV